MKSHHFQAQNGPFALNVIFFRKTINIIIMYLLALFIMQNFKKILKSESRVMTTCHFWAKMVHLPINENFLEKALNNFHVFLFYLFFVQTKYMYLSLKQPATRTYTKHSQDTLDDF